MGNFKQSGVVITLLIRQKNDLHIGVERCANLTNPNGGGERERRWPVAHQRGRHRGNDVAAAEGADSGENGCPVVLPAADSVR